MLVQAGQDAHGAAINRCHDRLGSLRKGAVASAVDDSPEPPGHRPAPAECRPRPRLPGSRRDKGLGKEFGRIFLEDILDRGAACAGFELRSSFALPPSSLDVQEWPRQIGEIRSIENLDAGIVLAVKRRHGRRAPRVLGIV
jgi:hypothetical protein